MWESGYRVFPLYELKDGKCACGDDCHSPGKHPLLSGWQTCPHWSEEQFYNMIEYGQFTTGYGVVCSDLIVVDIDPRNGGTESYQNLVEDMPEIASAGMIVETGRRDSGKHMYFSAPKGVSLLQQIKKYKGVDFRSRVIYVVMPGSAHEAGNPYRVVYGGPDDIDAAPEPLVEALRRPERHRVEYKGSTLDVSRADLAEYLKFCNANAGREEWIRIGMALHHASGGSAFELWDEWSSKGEKYPGSQELQKQWHHFGKTATPVTIGTLIYYAEQGGYQSPVTFEPIEYEESEDYPFDVSLVDVRRPPGFVGKLAEWVAAQPRRARENLAVQAALVITGNHIGLRHIDARDKVTANLLTFGVADSGTGKEAIQQAFQEAHRATGISAAVHGAIKSDAEIYRNLMRHQAAYYNVDEISDFLEKIHNAKKRGGASYLDSVVATIMSVFTKANGYLLITGDAKDVARKEVLDEISRENKRMDEGGVIDMLKIVQKLAPVLDAENIDKLTAIQIMHDALGESGGCERKLMELTQRLETVDSGIKHPFLSMCGYGTPGKFHALMDHRSGTEGFFGRALVVQEKVAAPPTKENYKPTPLPEEIKNTLTNLFYGGYYDITKKRVEYSGERVEVPTEPEANDMLDEVSKWMDEKAAEHVNTSGLSPLYLRGYELVSKVSFILGAPGGLRTAEHVRWAFAYVIRDLEEKTMLIMANDKKLDQPSLALYSRIMAALDQEHWMAAGAIRNKCRGYKREEIDRMLKECVDRGDAEMVETVHPRNKSIILKYRRA